MSIYIIGIYSHIYYTVLRTHCCARVWTYTQKFINRCSLVYFYVHSSEYSFILWTLYHFISSPFRRSRSRVLYNIFSLTLLAKSKMAYFVRICFVRFNVYSTFLQRFFSAFRYWLKPTNNIQWQFCFAFCLFFVGFFFHRNSFKELFFSIFSQLCWHILVLLFHAQIPIVGILFRFSVKTNNYSSLLRQL